jgi:THO complex subunit 1
MWLEQCDPSLVWYMIEELLDSQSIDGCRRVFDYLESRRERLVTVSKPIYVPVGQYANSNQKFFKKRREMVILRCCNELLRRLSRAEDAVFCGRVFIFLFQSFPLGDRSSVNTKGEFNVENITTFEDTVSEPQAPEGLQDAQKAMDKPEIQIFFEDQPPSTNDEAQSGNTNSRPVLDTNALYPIFWKLQEVFANPPLIFEAGRLDQFKIGLELSLAKFKAVPKVIQTSAPEASRGTKRKASEIENGEKFVSTFNPKYLTSRELFDLEVGETLAKGPFFFG